MIVIVMTLTVALTNNWQLHVPLVARKIAGLDRPGLVNVTVKMGQLVVTPKKSKILSLAGSLHHDYVKNPLNIDKIRDEIDYSQA